MNPSIDAFREGLTARADERLIRLHEIQRDMRQLAAEEQEIIGYIESLNPLLQAEGLPAVVLETRGGTGFAAPGNRSADMPPRRQNFAQMTLGDAVVAVLGSNAKAMHADDLAREIWLTKNRAEVRRAKTSLVSTLSEGVKKKHWRRVGPNVYTVQAEGEEVELPTNGSVAPASTGLPT